MVDRSKRMRLGDLLQERGIVSAAQLDIALLEQRDIKLCGTDDAPLLEQVTKAHAFRTVYHGGTCASAVARTPVRFTESA